MHALALPVTAAALREYGHIPISFDVRSRFDVQETSPGTWTLIERAEAVPWVKDYDADGALATWPSRFDVATWNLIYACQEDARVGGAVLVRATPNVDLLEGRDDLAYLWDLRVRPEHRRTGVGAFLVAAVGALAWSHGCRELRVETQNINVPACRLYERSGARLIQVNRGRYARHPDELQLIWSRPI